MNPYTVVLARPECIKNEELEALPPVKRVYLANRINADSAVQAVERARLEIYEADFDSDGWAVTAPDEFTKEDYIVLFVFEGHIDPVMYGWETTL